MTLTANGYTLREQETGLNLFATIDAVTDVIDRQIQRYKGKVYRTAQAKKSGRIASIRVADESATSEAGDELEAPLSPELGKAA